MITVKKIMPYKQWLPDDVFRLLKNEKTYVTLKSCYF